MPLIGLVNPDHNERAADEPGREPEWMSVDEVLAAAQTGDPKWSPWPYELIKSALNEHQERDYISSSMLTGGCGRGKVLERRADYVSTVDDMYASLMGTLIHRTLENAERHNAVAEWRFFTEMKSQGKDVTVSCSPDVVLYEEPDAGIWDWKKTENPPGYYPWKSHRSQVEINRYIVNHAERWLDPAGLERPLPFSPWEVTFRHLVLVYLAPRGPKVLEIEKTQTVESKKTGKPVRRALPYVAGDEEVLAYLQPRLDAMVLALDSYPEWPVGLEEMDGFNGPPGWQCHGKPWCSLPNCLAKRYPHGLAW